MIGIPCVLSLLLYLVLLITPIRLPFGSEAAQSIAQAALPDSSDLQLGQMALALEKGVWPVIQFSPVVYSDKKSGARVVMEALEVGFSPARAVFGQPGATVTIVRPHVQLVQDLFGPRVTSFDLVSDQAGGAAIVQVHEGEDTFPSAAISAHGIGVSGTNQPVLMRSDNDWLIYNLEASDQGIADIVEQAAQGRFSKLVVRDGIFDTNDAVYGLYRRFDNIEFEISPSRDRRDTEAVFSATLAGRKMTGNLSRTVDDQGNSRLAADLINVDFAAFLPFIDDATSIAALRGGGALSIDVNFQPAGGRLVGGGFKIDLTGLDLRIGEAYFPVASSILDINWSPEEGRFNLAEAALQVGNSFARLSGVFAMGLDAKYGPTIGISLQARDVVLHPSDMDAPEAPFDTMNFAGWSAPLYGALGIDRFVARKGEAEIELAGRVDMLVEGMGLDMTVVGHGVTADDAKRVWPYFLGEESRDWFVANVTEGTVAKGLLKFNFPVGSLAQSGEDKPFPEGAMHIDVTGANVVVRPTETMAPIAIDGDTRLQIDDANVTVSAGGGRVATAAGEIIVTRPALIMDNSDPAERLIEVSGNMSGAVQALVALVREQQPDLIDEKSLPIDINSITGAFNVGLVSTIRPADETTGTPLAFDYAVNGTMSDFASSQPIQDRKISNGQLAFNATQLGYQIGGSAEIDGMAADLEISGTPETDPAFRLSSSVDVAELAKMGFDASDFLAGKVRFTAQPMPDGTIQMAVDLKDARLTIKDLRIRKETGVAGAVQAIVRQNGDVTELSNVDLSFGTVRVIGGLVFDAKDGLKSAEFSHFGLSSGDSAQLSVSPISNGYAVQIRGQQLDLKPMLKQFFGLGQGAGGIQSSQFKQSIALDVKLDRALGYYATTAFNVALDVLLRGSDVRRANITAQFSEGNSLAVTTNPAPNGRTMSIAFNDAGTILRLLGVYSQLAGGAGNLVLTTDNKLDAEAGQLVMRQFAIVNEANVAQILGNHADSRTVIAAQNRLDFDVAQVEFTRRADRVEVTKGMLAGDMVGGTMRGFIYTKQNQYDLTGTYVPLYGLNNVFQKIPLLGPLLGGRDGEGLVGVTFAVNGPLDNPQFKINPLSALLPGAFRELLEFRAQVLPPAH